MQNFVKIFVAKNGPIQKLFVSKSDQTGWIIWSILQGVVMLVCRVLGRVGIQLGVPGSRYFQMKNRYRLRLNFHLVQLL